jgi:tetratricopeptide (TPR) repeat protein
MAASDDHDSTQSGTDEMPHTDVPEPIARALEMLALTPTRDEAWSDAEEAARAAQRPEEVADALAHIVKTRTDRHEVVSFGMRAVKFVDEWFDDPGRIVPLLERVLAVDPDADWALERLVITYTRRSEWSDLLAAYERIVTATSDVHRKKSLLEEAAHVARDFAHDDARAIDVLKQLFDIDPDNDTVASALERLLTDNQRHADLVQLWSSRIERVDAAHARDLRVRVASASFDGLRDAAEALKQAEQAMAPGDPPAELLALLERIGDDATTAASLRRRALTTLRDHFATIGAESDRERVLMGLIACTHGAERARVHADLAERFARTDRPRQAMEQLGAVIALEHGDADARAKLRSLANEHGEHALHVEILVRAADAAIASVPAAGLLGEAAQVLLVQRDDPDAARRLFVRAFDSASDDVATAVPIGRALVALLVGAEHESKRIDVLERLASLSHDRNEWAEAARLAEAAGDLDRALANWKHRLDLDPRDLEALDATIALLERGERWRALAPALRARIDAARPPMPDEPPKPKKAAAARSKKKRGAVLATATPAAAFDPRVRSDLVRLAEVQFTRLRDVDSAAATWAEIVSAFGPDDASDDALAEIAKARGDRNDLLAVLDGALARATDPGRRATLLARLGHAHRADDADRAAAHYRDALDLDPACLEAREGLRALLDDGRIAASHVHALAAAYAASRDVELTLQILEHRLAAAASATERAAVLLESAALHESRGEMDDALVLLRRAFELAPGDAEIEGRILSHARTRNAWDAAIDAYRRAADAAVDKGLVARLRVRTALAMESAGDLENANAMFAEVRAEHPGDLDATIGVVRTAAARSDWDASMHAVISAANALQEIPQVLVEAAETAARAHSAWATAAERFSRIVETTELPPPLYAQLTTLLARWHLDERNDAAAAMLALHRSIARSPSVDALRDLARLQRAEPGRPLFETLSLLARLDPADPDVPLEAARTAIERLDDRAAARPFLTHYLEALTARVREAPGTPLSQSDLCSALDEVIAFDRDAAREHDAIETLRATVSLPVSDEGRHVRRHAASLAALRLENSALAIELLSSLHRDAPDDRAALRALAALHEANGNATAWRDSLERLLALAESMDERLSVRLQLARALDASTDRSGAIAALRENLAEHLGHGETLEAIGTRFARESRHTDHAALLVEQATRLESIDANRAAALWQRAAAVYEERLGDLEEAVAAHRRAVAPAPDVASFDALARRHTARADHALAARALDDAIRIADRAVIPAFAVRLARALHASRNADRALDVLRRTLADQPEANDVRMLLADYLRQDQAWDAVAKLLADGARFAPDAKSTARLLDEAATIRLERLHDPDAAVPLRQRATEALPSDATLRVAYAGALRSAGRLADAERVLETLLQEYGRRRPAERALVHLELARIAQEHGQLAHALEQLDIASGMDFAHTGILRMLGDLSRYDGQYERAERAYRTLLMIVRRHDPNRDDGTSEQSVGPSEVLYELHRIAERTNTSRHARELLEGAFEAAAVSPSESRRLERTLRKHGRIDLLVKALRARLGRAKDPETCADALSDLADALDLVPGSEREALDARLQALANAPRATALHDKMLSVAKRGGQVAAYAEVLAELADRARDDGETDLAVDVLVRLATVEIEELGRPTRAIDALRKADALGGTNARVLFALERAFFTTADEHARMETLRRIVDAAPASVDVAHRVDALYRLAEIQLGEASTRDEGLKSIAAALQRDPQPVRAARLLRTVAVAYPHDSAILALYLRVARDAQDDALLLDALERRAGLPDASLDVFREAATLAIRIGSDRADPLLALTVERARERPDAADVREWALVLLFERARDRDDAASAARWLNEAIDGALRESAPTPRLQALGRLANGPGGDPHAAARVYEHLRERTPNDPAVWEPLLAIYRRLGDLDALEHTIKIVADHVWDNAQRNALRLERARVLLQRPDRVDEAISALRYVLGDEPEHDEASELLRDVLRRAGRTHEYAAVLRQQLAHAWDIVDAPRIVALSRELGPLLEHEDRRAAIDVYRTASECVPIDRDLIERQLRLYADDEVDPQRADALDRLLALGGGADVANVALTLGVVREKLGDANAATRAFERGLAASPGHAELTSHLERLYRDRGEWSKLADLIERDAQSRESPRQAVARLREAATIHRTTLNDAARAAATLKRARALAPGDIALLVEYTEALSASGDPATAVVELGTALARGIADPKVHADLLVRRAAFQTAAGRDDAALADLEKAFALSKDIAVGPLRALLESRRATAVTRRDKAAESTAVLALANVASQIGDAAAAASLLDRWLLANGTDRAAWRALTKVHAAAGRWPAVADAARRRIAIEDGAGLVEAAVDLADACEKLGRPADARSGLEAVLKTHPREEAIRSRLAALYEASGDHRGVAMLSLAAVDGARDDGERFKLLVRAGETLLRIVKDPAAALGALERAWKLRHGDLETATLMADALLAQRRLTEAEAVLRAAAQAAKGRRSRDLGQVQYRLAQIARDTGDAKSALAWLSSALESDFQNAQIASEVADAAIALGEDETALRALRAISLMKNPAPMTKAVAFVKQGEISLRQNDRKKAVFFARKALLEDPQSKAAQELLKRSE